tara:strand:+ start:2772 stop:3272 length:501 start_codon:yes stop_codon:yes gene_type:complete
MNDMTNKERIANKLAPLMLALENTPHDRVQMAVDDCLADELDDKERDYAYGYARKSATRFGYGEYLPKSGSREVDPNLVTSIAYINKQFTTFVTAGLEACPELLLIMRPKKNKQGVITYTQETLIKTLASSCELWHTNQYKNKNWDGQVETMVSIAGPTSEANSEE